MDYHVFVLSRIHELVDTGQPAREAVHRGIADTAVVGEVEAAPSEWGSNDGDLVPVR